MNTYPDNPDAYAQAESGVMFEAPEQEPLFLQIDKRWSASAQVVEAVHQLLTWKKTAQAIFAGQSLPQGIEVLAVRDHLAEALGEFDAAIDEILERTR